MEDLEKRGHSVTTVLGKGARMLSGTREENAQEILELVAAKGGLK